MSAFIVEESDPNILYPPGAKNAVENTFSSLPCCDVLPTSDWENASVVHYNFTSKGLNISNDYELLECFLNIPLPDIAKNNPEDFKWIHT